MLQANILVSRALRACLADFGLSSAKDTVSVKFTAASMRTQGGGGTPNWMAPELLMDHSNPESIDHETRRADQASDVYSLAMVCYELPEKRLTAAQAVQRLCSLPGRPTDNRPLDEYTIPPLLRAMYTQAQHPFAMLEVLHRIGV
ncbi:hypothetical protein HWV62_43738 [Athelia sp. TMB]|nr:hypothetical protein HWV62_43738 [Athelia sp. TMB]